MAHKTTKMLQKSLDAFVNLDVETARSVCAADDSVDNAHSDMYQQVEEAIQAQPQLIKQYFSYISMSRYLERIADHATNIAEDVMYLVEGDIVRHSGEIF
jgi:phosphate transport system protein